MDDIQAAVKRYILDEFLAGEDPNALTETTPLITGGILDSLATVKLVVFLETNYACEIEPHEIDVEKLNTIAAIAALVREKRALDPR